MYQICLSHLRGTKFVNKLKSISTLSKNHLSACSLSKFSTGPGEETYLQYKQVSPDVSPETRLANVRTEVDIIRQEGRKLPVNISKKHWKELAALETSDLRKDYLDDLLECERVNERHAFFKRLQKREIKREVRYKRNPSGTSLSDGFELNAVHLKWTEGYMNNIYNAKLMSAKMFGQDVMIDFSYDAIMKNIDKESLARSIASCVVSNRTHVQPFNLKFLNFNPKADSSRLVKKNCPYISSKDCLIDIHSSSPAHTPVERLVYVTQAGREDLHAVCPHTSYVLPALGTLRTPAQEVLARAKSLGVRVQRLPLDRYVQWGMRPRLLPVHLILRLLLEVRQHGNWPLAFQRHIPPLWLRHDPVLVPKAPDVAEHRAASRMYGRFDVATLSRDYTALRHRPGNGRSVRSGGPIPCEGNAGSESARKVKPKRTVDTGQVVKAVLEDF